MIEGYSNLCEGDTSNVVSSDNCSCFLLYFKVDPSTCLWLTDSYGPLFYSIAEISYACIAHGNHAYLMEIVIKCIFSH